jgi:hypothetical protein
VHHCTYERLGEELPQDVVTVCDSCHVKIHKSNAKLENAHWAIKNQNQQKLNKNTKNRKSKKAKKKHKKFKKMIYNSLDMEFRAIVK